MMRAYIRHFHENILMHPIYKEIGGKIRTMRKKRRLTQTHLAEKLGIARVSLTNWEAGRSGIPLSAVVDIAEILDVQDYRVFLPGEPMREGLSEVESLKLTIAEAIQHLSGSESLQKTDRTIRLLQEAVPDWREILNGKTLC
jgi:transcriptional regulator with XRE-family HTH domain